MSKIYMLRWNSCSLWVAAPLAWCFDCMHTHNNRSVDIPRHLRQPHFLCKWGRCHCYWVKQLSWGYLEFKSRELVVQLHDPVLHQVRDFLNVIKRLSELIKRNYQGNKSGASVLSFYIHTHKTVSLDAEVGVFRVICSESSPLIFPRQMHIFGTPIFGVVELWWCTQLREKYSRDALGQNDLARCSCFLVCKTHVVGRLGNLTLTYSCE